MENIKYENSSKNKKAIFQLFSIEQRENAKPFWREVGVAFENRDGSFNLIAKVGIQPGMKLQLRRARPRERTA